MIHPAIILGLFQIFFGTSGDIIPPETRTQHAEVLRYQIRRLDVGDANGRLLLAKVPLERFKFPDQQKIAFSAALNGGSFDEAMLAGASEKADEVRAMLQAALAKPYWQSSWELPTSSQDSLVLGIMVRPLMAHLLRKPVPAMTVQHLADLELLLGITNLSIKNGISLEECLSGISIHNFLNQLVIQWLRQGWLDSAAMGELLGLMRHSPSRISDFREGFRHAFARELRDIHALSDSMEGMDGWIENPEQATIKRYWLRFLVWLTYDADQTEQLFNALAADIVSRLEEPFSMTGHPAFSVIRNYKRPGTAREYLRHNSWGKGCTMNFLGKYENLLLGMKLKLTGREAAAAVIALQLYRQEKQSALSPSLEMLVPDYLPQLPLDLVNGKLLRYDREKRLIWGVGPNLAEQIPVLPEQPSLLTKDGRCVVLIP